MLNILLKENKEQLVETRTPQKYATRVILADHEGCPFGNPMDSFEGFKCHRASLLFSVLQAYRSFSAKICHDERYQNTVSAGQMKSFCPSNSEPHIMKERNQAGAN